jgi:spermidine synthase
MYRPNILMRGLSWIRPVILKRTKGDKNPVLEISMHRGRLMLDAQKVNYSYGSLHTVMEHALLHAILVYGTEPASALILGYGAGSAAALIGDMFPECEIVGIEHDESVIKLADKYFPVRQAVLHHADALLWLRENTGSFDLVICDLFTEDSIPAFTKEPEFFNLIAEKLNVGGVLIQNTMFTNDDWKPLYDYFSGFWQNAVIKRMNQANYLMFGQKR